MAKDDAIIYMTPVLTHATPGSATAVCKGHTIGVISASDSGESFHPGGSHFFLGASDWGVISAYIGASDWSHFLLGASDWGVISA